MIARLWRWLRGKPRRGLQRAKGRDLDALAISLGVTRKHYWWVFREWDSTLRMRALRTYVARPRH